MRHLVKLVLIIGLLAATGLIAYAYVGDLTPHRSQVTRSVTLDGS